MKKFNEFREDQFQSIVENLSEEDRNYIMEVTGDNPGLGMGILGAAARTAKFGLYDAPKFIIKKGLQLANSKPMRALYAYDAGKSTVDSALNREPWYQTVSKGLQGYYAKKTGGLKRALAGELGQHLLPGDKTKSSK